LKKKKFSAVIEEEEEKEKIKPPVNHDFKETPIFKQFVLKQSEGESLQDTELVKDMIKEIDAERLKEQKELKVGKINDLV